MKPTTRAIIIGATVWAVLATAFISAAWVRVQSNHDAAETAQQVARNEAETTRVIAALRIIGGNNASADSNWVYPGGLAGTGRRRLVVAEIRRGQR